MRAGTTNTSPLQRHQRPVLVAARLKKCDSAHHPPANPPSRLVTTCTAQAEQQPGSTSGGSVTSSSTTDAPSQPPSAIAPVASTSGAAGPATGLLSSPDQQAAAFGLLAATSLAFGAAALAAPQLLVSFALGVEATPLDLAFTRIAGATMFISAAVEYSLRDAVKAGHLKSETLYQRLLMGVIAKSSLYLAAFLLSPELWNPVLAAFYPTSAAASILISSATLQSAFQQAGAPSVLQGCQGIWGFSTPKTRAAWGYAVAILLYVATVAACYAPEVIFTGQPMTPAGLLLKHTWAPGFLLAGAACYVLKDAADRGRLGASTFVRLNQGLAAVEAGYSAVFGAAIASGLAVGDGSAWSNLVGSLALVLFCGYQAAMATKK